MTEREHRHDSDERDTNEGSPSREQSETHRQTTPSVSPDHASFYASAEEIAAALESHRATVVRSLRRQRFSRETAEEAFDLALVNFYRSRPSIGGPSAALARWLRRAAFHRANELRDRMGSIEVELMADVDDRPADDHDQEALHWRLTLRAVMARVFRLRPEDRDAVLGVVQRELADMGEEEEAARLAAFLTREGPTDRDLNYMRLHRARTKLRRFRGRLAVVPLGRWWRRVRMAVEYPAAAAAGMGVAAMVVVATVSPARSTDEPTKTSVETGIPVRAEAAVPDGASGQHQRVPVRDSPESTGSSPRPDVAQAPRYEATLRTPPLPVSDTNVEKHPRPPGDKSIVCVRNAGPVASACVRHPLAPDPLSSEAVTIEN